LREILILLLWRRKYILTSCFFNLTQHEKPNYWFFLDHGSGNNVITRRYVTD
jgi:hypothetical protein